MKKFFLYAGFAAVSLAAGVFLQLSFHKDFHTIDGQSGRWADFKGDWLVINYFAEWCAPCLKEVPELNAFHREYDIPLFAISFDGEPDDKMRNLMTKYNMTFPVISAEPMPELPVPKPRALPTTYILNPDGEIQKTIQGEVTHEMLFAAIEQLKQ